jgi:hypothetical protein
VTVTPGTRSITNCAATIAFGCPTSFGLNESLSSKRDYKVWQTSPEEKLTIEIADINRVHIDYMKISESRQREVRENLAPKAAGANNKHFA